MNFICKMDGEPATWPCPSPGCPLFGDCLSEREGNSKPPMTNTDHIRAMSDEELLDFMKKSVANAYMCKIMRTEPMFLTLEWL